MSVTRHSEIWLPGYLKDRLGRVGTPPLRRVWLAVADHYEPYWNGADDTTACDRVQRWRKAWPEIAARSVKDSAGRSPKYTFFYPQEEYRASLLDQLAEMAQAGIADVEIHIHHDREGRQNFIDRMSSFRETLHREHGLLRAHNGSLTFGFIHGNWALDNSLANGYRCGLNDEITLLNQLGCYADFTMPSGDSPSQSRIVNTIYWCKDDPNRPKSYDWGAAIKAGDEKEGDLLMIPGPFGLRWRGRWVPRTEQGELASYDPPTAYRAKRWLDLAPRFGSDVFIKLFTHGTQERHSELLLGKGLEQLFEYVRDEAVRRRCEFYFVSAWEMFLAIDALRRKEDPVRQLKFSAGETATQRPTRDLSTPSPIVS
ncbi:MAG: hypothetical protein WBE13_10820 [Candidatus Acidiferrum sp.]